MSIGTLYFKNGRKYIGNFKKNDFHGDGKLYGSNGNLVYDGEYKNGKAYGNGTYYYNNGDRYEGELIESFMDGVEMMLRTLIDITENQVLTLELALSLLHYAITI